MFARVLRMIIVLAMAASAFVPANGALAAEKADEKADKDATFDVGSTFAAATGEEKIQWHGYYEFEYIDQEGKNATYDAHKITVWMGVPINEKVFLSSEIEYEHFPRLEDSGTARPGGNGEIKIDSSQLSIIPFEGFRGYAGIWYVPFGIEYLSYPGYKNKLVTRPKVMKSGGIIPGTWSAAGIGFNNRFDGIGHLDVYSINGDAKNAGVSRDSSTGGNQGKSIGARLMLDDFVEGFNLGASFVSGKWDAADKFNSVRTGIHLRVDSDILFGNDIYPVLLAEWVTGKDDNASSIIGRDKKVSGYYAQISSLVHPLTELVARYGVYDDDEEVTDNQRTETSFGVVLHLIDNFQIKGEYQINDEKGANRKDNNVTTVELVAWW
ncbi:MAG: hypothetical protein IEMM0002_1582 [bacterium]|nr:MAG: hypothetical protein IEMM0002_1582 [bacterium]